MHFWRETPWELSNPTKHFAGVSYTNIEYVRRYDKLHMPIFKHVLDLANALRPKEPRLIVDFGCSCGKLMEIFRDCGWNIMGIEISPTAQKTLGDRGLPWVSCLEEMKLPFGSVDIVTMLDCLYYLPDPVSTLKQIRLYLKPGGSVILRNPTRAGLIQLLLSFSKSKAFHPYLWADHIHEFSCRSTCYTLQEAGFADIRFIREKRFPRRLKFEILHRTLQALDYMTFHRYDLSLSWLVSAIGIKV